MGKESSRLLDSTNQAHLQYSACKPEPTTNVPVIVGFESGNTFNTAEACEHKKIMWDFFIPKEDWSFREYCIGTVKDIGQYVVNVTCSDSAQVAMCVSGVFGLFCVAPPAVAVGITEVFASKSLCVGCLGTSGMGLGGIALPPLMTCTGLSIWALFERISREKDDVIDTALTELVRRVEYGVHLFKYGSEVVSIQPSKGNVLTDKEQKYVDHLKNCFTQYQEKNYQAMLAELENLSQLGFPVKIQKHKVHTGTNYKISVSLAKPI